LIYSARLHTSLIEGAEVTEQFWKEMIAGDRRDRREGWRLQLSHDLWQLNKGNAFPAG